ncbi:MaoC/PaaZ C-terminal domain-containing protein [Mycobacterium syngnathidarum]
MHQEPTPEDGRDLAGLAIDGLWHAEDLRAGDFMDIGRAVISRDEIIAFARQYDPQAIHLDATSSPFGDVIASAAHTIAVFSGLASRVFFPRMALVAGKGIDRLRLPNPVRPSAVLSGRVRIDDVAMRDGRGDVIHQAILEDQAGRVVLSFVGITVIARRSPA